MPRLKTIKCATVLLTGSLLVVCMVFAAEIPKKGAPPRNLSQQPDGHWSPYSAPAAPEGATVHVVVRGDTLWDLSKEYLENPYLWPQIWEMNPYIKNPHWIYPGDPIVIKPPVVITDERIKKEIEAQPAPPPEEAPAPTPTEPVVAEAPPVVQPPIEISKGVPAVTGADLYCAGFIASKDLPQELFIVGAEQERDKTRYGEGEIVYLNKGSRSEITAGSEYVIMRPMGKAKSKANGHALGHYVAELGKLRVLVVHKDSATAQILFACDSIFVGDLLLAYNEKVSPLVRNIRETEVYVQPLVLAARITEMESRPEMERYGHRSVLQPKGHIALAKDDLHYLGAGNIIYLDVGNNSGVRAGQILTIYRDLDNFGAGGLQREEPVNRTFMSKNKNFLSHSDKAVKQRAMPKRVLGEAIVLFVQERSATAKILYNREEVLLGDKVGLFK